MDNLKVDRVFVRWYKDRDFPEVKSGNDDIIAVISDSEQLQRIIDSHNLLLQKYEEHKELLRKAVNRCADLEQQIKDDYFPLA